MTCVSEVGLGTVFRFSFMAEKSFETEKHTKKIKKKNLKKKSSNSLDVITELVIQEDIESVFQQITGQIIVADD